MGSWACFCTITRRSPFWGGSTASTGGGSGRAGSRRRSALTFASTSAGPRKSPTATTMALLGRSRSGRRRGSRLGGDALDVLHPADDGLPVGVRLEGEGADLLAEEAARIVLGPRAALLDDDLALGGDLLGIEQEVLHPIGLEVQHEVELVGGDVDEVRGHVLRGEGVVLAAVLLDEPGELRGA